MPFHKNPLDPDYQHYHPDLEQEIRDCVEALEHNENWFNQETEPELIEQRIFEREALQRRYQYLLRRARALGLRQGGTV